MKPTPQISSEQSFPFTDYNYQSTLKASRTCVKEKRGSDRLRGFWKLGTEFHGAEAVYGDAADFFVFTLMGLICTWPFFSVGSAIYHGLFG
ncbi:MAG TPA: hypothetical protein VIU85_07290 [Chthoniobacterales bacterium]